MKIKIIILSAFLSVLLFFSNFSVKANNVVFPAFPEPVEGQSSTHYIILYLPDFNEYRLIKPTDPSKVSARDVSSTSTYIDYDCNALEYVWKTETTAWVLKYENPSSSIISKTNANLAYSSFDIKYTDGTVFFQRAPIKVSFSTQVKELEMGAVLKAIVKVIPMVMIAVVGFLGFRKAFNLLLRVFQGA
jgi:hypothetical protein